MHLLSARKGGIKVGVAPLRRDCLLNLFGVGGLEVAADLIAFNSVLNPHLLSALWLQLSQNVPRNDHGIANPFVLRTKLKKCYANHKNTLVFDMGGIYPLFTPFSTCMALGCASS